MTLPVLHGTFRVSKTQAADEALELIRDGVADSFSVGFSPIAPGADEPIRNGDHVVRTHAHLSEVSVVTWPAYPSAKIQDIRSADVLYDQLEHLRSAKGLDPDVVDSLQGSILLAREGKTLSASTKAALKEVSDHLGNANSKLGKLMGSDVTNAHDNEEDDESNAEDESGRSAITAALMRRRMAILNAR